MSEYRKLSRKSEEADTIVSEKMAVAVASAFPVEGNFFSVRIANIQVEKSSSGMKSVKKALVNGSSIMNKIKAKVTLVNKKTGQTVDSVTRVIMTVPAFTKKGSFIVEGNSYVLPFQQRLRPGVYTLKKRNGEIESMFNVQGGKNFAIKLSNGVFNVKVGSANVPLYSILVALGAPSSLMEKSWGKELFEQNRMAFKSGDAEKFLTLFSYGNKEISTHDNVNDLVKGAIASAKVDAPSVKATLGIDSSRVSPTLLIASSMKLLGVFNDRIEPDDRENMMFKKIMAPEDMMAENFSKSIREITSKIKFKLSNPNTKTVSDVMGDGGVMLGRPSKMFITSSSSSLMPEEYNPLMMHMANHLLTPMGDGGIGDTRALNLDTKAVHNSHLGFVDPIVSPEGASVGITLAITGNAYISEDGSPAMKVMNPRTNREEVVPLSKLWESKVAYPVSSDRLKSEGVTVRDGNSDIRAKKASDIDYLMIKSSDMHAPSTNFVPLGNSADANRTNMAQKHKQQALSLKHREEANVSVSDGNEDYSKVMARESSHLPTAKRAGRVSAIRDGVITIKYDDGTVGKEEFVQDMPLARKTFINHEPSVAVGDKVKKGQHLADSNFTKNGGMALGKNVRTAWLSMRGNRNDGIVISEEAAEMFTSEHMYKENINVDPTDIQDMKRFTQLFPKEVSKWGAYNYDEKGVIKKGSTLLKHQPMAFLLKKSDAKQLMSKMEKVLFQPFKAKIISWHHDDSGKVIEAQARGGEIRLNVKVESPMKVGDKMAGRYGNKGVVTRIAAVKDMPIDAKTGEPVHVTMTAAGVVSRTNGGSLIEAGLSKISDKTGKRYVLEHYGKKDNLEFMESEAKKHGVEMKDVLINPETGKPFPKKIFVGKPFMMKLFKDGESGMASVGVGATDINGQPTKGGSESAASFSNMETNALLAHDAKGLLAEAKSIKGQKNDEYFDAFRQGLPVPPPVENFAGAKFKAYLEQMGVNVRVDRNTSEYSLIPKTDADTKKMSAGKIKNADTIYAKNGKPVKGGLFDESLFGGPSGGRSAHIDLGTKILNPLYKDHVSRLLGISSKALISELAENGTKGVEKTIKSIDVNNKIKTLKEEILKSNNPQVANRNIKLIKMLSKTKAVDRKLADVMFISKIAVISPLYRPASKDANGDISINDLNLHYQDIHAMSKAFFTSNKLKDSTKKALNAELYKSVGALYGVEESPNKKIRDKKIKGVLDILGGETPKMSYAQQNLLRVKQFMSGRGVIVPARKDIHIDQIEIPEAMGLKMYEPHIARRMSRMGYSPSATKDLIESKDPKVLHVLKDLGKEIPLAYNRAPTLWKHGILGGFPVFTKGSVIGVNPLTETALGSDYDGDQIAVHVPVTQKGIMDIKTKMLPSQNLFNERLSHLSPSLLSMPDQDSTLGIYKASVPTGKGKPIRVKTIHELKMKIDAGEIQYTDIVKVG